MLRYVFFSCSPGHKNVITNRRISKDLLLLIFWKRRKCSIYSAKTLAEPGVTSPLNVAAGQPSELGNTVGGHAGQEGAVPPGSEELRKCSQESGSPNLHKCHYHLCGSAETLHSQGLAETVPVPLVNPGSSWSSDSYSPACISWCNQTGCICICVSTP